MPKASASSSGGATTTPRTVLVAVAHGTEEIEAVTVIDTLVRAGAKVTTASVSDNIQVTCSRGVKIEADVLISAVASESYDLIVLPGGMPGATHLRDSVPLKQMLTKQHADGKWGAAICAAPWWCWCSTATRCPATRKWSAISGQRAFARSYIWAQRA
jgi:4-methyl-5(b-hydroxyethyl)-thiazole monophosphate biosynthesis